MSLINRPAAMSAVDAPDAEPALAIPTCATVGPLGTAYDAGVNCRTMLQDGHQRRFKVYVPASALAIGRRLRVVFMCHGGGGDGEQFLAMSGWREQSDASGAITVFPTAMRYRIIETGRLATRWRTFLLDDPLQQEIDASELPPGSAAGSPVPADDVGFVDAIVSDLRSQLPIDARRIYASGFSNGAGFAIRLSIERSDKFAAIGFSAGGGGYPPGQVAPRPVPTWATMGTLDDNILALTDPPLTELPLAAADILANPTLEMFYGGALATLGLDPADVGFVEQPNATLLRWPAAGTGPDGATFRFGMIGGLPHAYPKADNNDAGFAAAAEFWEFFEDHRRP